MNCKFFNYLRRGIRYIVKGPEIIREKPLLKVNITYSTPTNRLIGKKVLITGGTRGIGLAIAKKIVSEGGEVVVTGRDEKALKQVAKELNCHYICSDILDFDKLENIIDIADNMLGGLNCLVNNAGISLHEGNIRNVSVEQYDKQFDTNLKSSYFLSKYFIQKVEKETRKGCNILFVSSERGTYVDDIPYGLTKNAINCLVKGLARRVICNDIRVNAVAPGITATELTGYNPDGNLFLESGMSKRVYYPEEIAEIAIFLLSDISNCLSGQILTCDEGKSINSYWK